VLKQLEGENTKLKKLLAEQMLDAAVQREGPAPGAKAAHPRAAIGLAERRAYSIIGADRKTVRFRSRRTVGPQMVGAAEGRWNPRADPRGGSPQCSRSVDFL